MGRTAEGWKLLPRRGIQYVRFRHNKRRYDVSTGERDPGKASAAAARIYAEIVGGRWRPVGAPAGPLAPLVDVIALWIADLSATHAENTVGLYELYAKTHWLPFFERMDRVRDESALGDYGRSRLRAVTRDTVQKEIGALRTFLRWCVEKRVVSELPKVPALPSKATGVRSANRKQKATDLTPEEVEVWIAELPATSPGKKGGSRRFAVRPRFRFAWETGLRPSTLDKLSVPEHYRKGAAELVITDEIDKARFGRTLPLTAAARAALDEVCPEKGVIFGRHDYRDFVRSAAKRAGIDPAKVATFSPYDLRHARTQQLTEVSGNLPGVAYLVGHTRITTTDKYLRGTRRAAAKVLETVSNGCNSGGAEGEASAPNVENESVRRGGLEPPRCYPLAPQCNDDDLSARNGGDGERQQTPANADLAHPMGESHPKKDRALRAVRAEVVAALEDLDKLEAKPPRNVRLALSRGRVGRAAKESA